MFTLFAHKGLREQAPFDLTKTLKEYIKYAEPQIIIVSPGYLSTRSATTKLFLDDLFVDWYTQKKPKFMGITAGMNGANRKGNPVNLVNHYLELTAKQINKIYFTKTNGQNSPLATNRDHKKMVFFGEFTDETILQAKLFNSCSFPISINRQQLDCFIKYIKVTAVSTGSSNFSKTTYLGNGGVADKGESDLFMYAETDSNKNKVFYPSIMEGNSLNENIVPPILSKSVSMGKLPSISRNTLNNTLSNDEKYLTWMLYETLVDQLR